MRRLAPFALLLFSVPALAHPTRFDRLTFEVEDQASGERVRIVLPANTDGLYTFQRTLEAYKTSFTRDTTVVMTTGEGFLQYLKGETLVPKKAPAPTTVWTFILSNSSGVSLPGFEMM